MARLTEIVLPSSLRERLAQGHPWVYRDHVPPQVRLPSGAWAIVRCGAWRGYALWDAEGPIALRVFSTRRLPDTDWLRERLTAAWSLREPLRVAGVTAYRWVFGEGDGLPGIVVDRYNDVAIIQAYSAGTLTLVDDVAAMLFKVDPTMRSAALRKTAGMRSALDEDDDENGDERLRLIHGEPLPREVVAVEHGMRFAVALYAAQKNRIVPRPAGESTICRRNRCRAHGAELLRVHWRIFALCAARRCAAGRQCRCWQRSGNGDGAQPGAQPPR